MPEERPCGAPIFVRKTPSMISGTDSGRSMFLALVLRKLQPSIDVGFATMIAQYVLDDVAIDPEGETLDQFFEGFDQAGLNENFGARIYPSFLRRLSQYMFVPISVMLSC